MASCTRTASTSSRSSSTTRPTVRPTTSWPTPRCGTCTTISSTCRIGPDSTATGGRPGRATGPTTEPWRTSSRSGLPRAPPCWCRTITSRSWAGCWPSAGPTCARCTSCTRPSPTLPCSPCCPTTSRPSCSTAWPATGPAASTATSGRRASWPVTPRRGGRRRATFVAPLGPDAGGARGGGGGAGRRGGGGCAARRGGRSPHRGADRPHGAVEEHRAGDARLRGAARRAPRVAR